MVKPRDGKGRFLKSTSKILANSFSSHRTPPTDLVEIYAGKIMKGESSMHKLILQLVVP